MICDMNRQMKTSSEVAKKHLQVTPLLFSTLGETLATFFFEILDFRMPEIGKYIEHQTPTKLPLRYYQFGYPKITTVSPADWEVK